jgi:FtsH-binding integral membrane protein
MYQNYTNQQNNFPQQGYPQQGYPQQGYPQQGYPQQDYPQKQQFVDSTIKNQDIQMGQSNVSDGFMKNDLNDIEGDVEENISNKMRIGFIRKVYGVLSVQLAITCALIGLTFIPSVNELFHQQAMHLTCLIGGCIGIIIFAVCIACAFAHESLRRLNYFFLIGFTLCLSAILMTICSYYNASVVLIAATLTAGITISITAYTWRTSNDFTFCGAFLFGFLGCMIISIIFFIIGLFNNSFFRYSHLVICIGCVLLYSLYLIYDTQLIMGKFGVQYSIDDYVLAALNLYIDIIQIFLYVLRMFGEK